MSAAAFFAVAGALTWLATSTSTNDQPPQTVGMKRLSGTVAERLVYRIPSESFPRASCDACRMGRLKAGIFSLGGFCTIEFDNLVINLPSGQVATGGDEDVCERGGVTTAKPDEWTDIVGAFGLKPFLPLSKESGKIPRIAGVRVNGFTLNRMEGQTLAPVISAVTLKNSRKNIVLESVIIHRSPTPERVPSAILVLKPRPALKWTGGIWEFTGQMSVRRGKDKAPQK